MPGRNLTANPSCAVDTTNWTGGSAPTRLTGLTGTPRTTGASVPMSASAWASHFRVGGFASTTKNVTYTCVGWFRSSVTRTHRFYMSLYNGASTFVQTTTASDVSLTANTWTQVRFIATVPSTAGNHTLKYIHVDIPTAGTAGTLSASSIRIDQVSDNALTFADGDTSGWAWDGTTGASTSTEGAGGPGDPGEPIVTGGPSGAAYMASYTVAEWDTATQKFAYFSHDPGDLVLLSAVINSDIGNITQPVDNSDVVIPDVTRPDCTFTLVRSASTTNRATYVYRINSTNTVPGRTYVVGVAGNPGYYWGFSISRWARATMGNSAVTQGTGAPSLALTTTVAGSSIAAYNVDTVRAGGIQAWRTTGLSEPFDLHTRNQDQFRYYSACYPSSGVVGNKTIGLTAPTGQNYAMIGVEVIGTPAPTAGLFRPF